MTRFVKLNPVIWQKNTYQGQGENSLLVDDTQSLEKLYYIQIVYILECIQF